MEYEGIEQEILLEPENAIVGAVYSVNGKTGDVVLTTSDLENDSDYQTGDEVDAAIATAIAGKQDTLTAGNNIQISAENVISATDTTYSAGNGLNLSSENAFSVDTTVVATQQNLATEVQNRENADNALQAQIDGISASSDVVDIVGTYADLQNYDTSKLKDNDIIKVLQDSTQNNATTYYRWSTTTETFTLIGQEGPYYTKAAADAQFVPQTRTVNGKALSSNITLNASDVNALGTSDVVQTTGTSTSQVMSQNATTQELGTKLNIADYVVDDELKNSTNPVQNGVLYGLLGNMPTDFFSGNATTEQTGTEAQFTNALKISDIELQGDTFQQTYTGKNLWNNLSLATATNADKTYTANGDGTFTLSGTASATSYFDLTKATLPAGTYKLSTGVNATWSGNVVVSIEGSNYICYQGQEVEFTVSAEATMTAAYIRCYSGDATTLTVKPMIRLSSIADGSYEPYVGGTASPNPDYPQPVNVVTGTQTVTVSGKNLFTTGDRTQTGYGVTCGSVKNKFTLDGTATRNNFGETYFNLNGTQNASANYFNYDNTTSGTTLPAGTYTLSLNNVTGSFVTQSSVLVYISKVYSGSYPITTIASISVSLGSKSTTFTLSEETTVKIQFRVFIPTDTSIAVPVFNNYSFNLQLESGSTATPYESYVNTDYTVELGSIELAKIGNFKDYIYKSGDDWYVHKETGKGTLTGTTVGMQVAQQPGTGRFNIVLPTTWEGYMKSANAILSYCNSYQLVGQSDYNTSFDTATVDMNYALNFNSGGGNALRVKNIDASTVQEMKDSMTATPLVLYYALATATDTQITDSTLIGQLNALYNAKMLAGQTNFAVSAVSPNLPAILDITVFNANAQGLIANIRG